MADYIDREKLLNKLDDTSIFIVTKNKKIREKVLKEIDHLKSRYLEVIKSMPSVDAVEVVRCKDCKYCNDGVCDQVTYYHQKWGISTQYVNDDDYCKWGEKNEVN